MKSTFLLFSIFFSGLSWSATKGLSLGMDFRGVTGLTAECRPLPRTLQKGLQEQIIASCLDFAKIRAKKIDSNGTMAEFLKKLVNEAFYLAEDDDRAVKVPVLNELKINVLEGSFNLSTWVKTGIRLTIKGRGEAFVENKGKSIKIRMDKLKAGIIPLTTIFFEIAEQLKIPRVKVKRPFLIIDVDLMN